MELPPPLLVLQSHQIFLPLHCKVPILAILYVKLFGTQSISCYMIALCLVPWLGQVSISSCCYNTKKPLRVPETRVKTEGLGELAMVTTIKDSRFLLAKKKQSCGWGQALFSLCPVFIWRGFWPWARWKFPAGKASKHLPWSWQTVSSMVPFCQLCGWGRTHLSLSTGILQLK